MGNLISDFWRYKYKNREYFGVVEVIKGDLKYRKSEEKTELQVANALEYLQKTNKKIKSHMTVQSYLTYLNRLDKPRRDQTDESYYPFYLEFEPKIKPIDVASGVYTQFQFDKEYIGAADEAYRTVNYLVYQLDVHIEDILIVITNSRSIYLFINPKAYKLKPGTDLHLVYKEIFYELDQYIDFKYVDTHHFRFSGLIKTPGSFYKEGYVNPISPEELKKLISKPQFKNKLTKIKRNINKNIPGIFSSQFNQLYIDAKNRVKSNKESHSKLDKNHSKLSKDHNNDNVQFLKSRASCIQLIENSFLSQGDRNFALVSLAIAYKNAGYKEDQVLKLVVKHAEKWQHDEDLSQLKSKVRIVFNRNYKYSCEYVRENIDLITKATCINCKYSNCKKNAKFKVNKYAIDMLRSSNASLRHYRAYLVISANKLFNEYFDPTDYELDQRTVREMARYINATRELKNGLVKLQNNILEKYYLFPSAFILEGQYLNLGEKLKHYLALYTNFVYKAGDEYGSMRVSMQKVAVLLGYKHVSSAYRFIKELKDLGLAVFNKGYLFALYFSSYKVISIDRRNKSSGSVKTVKGANLELMEGKKIANGRAWRLERGSP